MAKTRREPRAARQLGTINNILQSQSSVRRNGMTPRQIEKRDSRGTKSHVSSQHVKLQDRIAHGERDSHSTCHFRERDHPRSSQRIARPSLEKPLSVSKDQRRSQSPQDGFHCSADGDRRSAVKPVENEKKPGTAVSVPVADTVHQLRSVKRKRETDDAEEDKQHTRIRKKHQATRSIHKQCGQSPPHSFSNPENIVAKASTVTTPQPKIRSHKVSDSPTQLATPPSSNATPERDSHDADVLKLVPTATDSTLIRKEAELLIDVTSEQSQKKQRKETKAAKGIAKRPRQMEKVRTTDPEQNERQTRRNENSISQRQTSVQNVQARAVRPESSFAPITPNYECNLDFHDYDHDSVPVLYSSMVQHSNDEELLTSPSEMLVLDALTVIEASSKPYTKPGWPTAIELLRRSPTMNLPTKVLKDVDLYLLESETEIQLHVATDRGLLLATEYLKLIGVPETQPVRFEGRIPPWAKAALRVREKRRVMQVWGTNKTVRESIALESHQIAAMRESHAELRQQREEEATSSALRLVERECTPEPSSKDHDETKKTETATSQERAQEELRTSGEAREIEILEAEPGHLPLPAGSVVIVYKIDADDVWAYGRLSGTDKTGQFPISLTCPLDWSLDRFAGTNDSLFKPLVESTDPTEESWNGLTHWVQQQGYEEGPTWSETVAAVASKAKYERERIMAARKNDSSTKPVEAKTDRISRERSPAGEASINGPRAGVASAAVAKETSATAPAKVSKPQIKSEKTLSKEPKSEAGHVMQEERTSIPQVNPPTSSTATIVDMPETHTAPSHTLAVSKDAQLGVQTMPRSVVDQEVRDAVITHTIAEEPEILVIAEQAEGLRSINDVKEVPVVKYGPFTVPRYDPFARNDDIEYDWGDSDEEL